MIAALIVLGGFLSFCATGYGAIGILGMLGNPTPSQDDDKSPLWFFVIGVVMLVMFVIMGVRHG